MCMSSGSGFGPSGFNAAYYERGSVDWRGARKGWGGPQKSYERYHQSKLANLLFTSALHDKLRDASQREGVIKAVACTPGVCATDMFVHVASQPGRPADLSAVPSVEDGACAQLLCICDPAVESGDLWGPPGMGGAPVRIPIAPPTVLVDERSKAQLWEVCEAAVSREVAVS